MEETTATATTFSSIVGTILQFVAAPAFMSVLSWLLAKKKYDNEAKRDEVENLNRTLEFYQKFIQDSESRLETYIRRGEDDRVEIYKLQDTVQCLLKMSCVDKDCSSRRYTPLSEIEAQMIRRKKSSSKKDNETELK